MNEDYGLLSFSISIILLSLSVVHARVMTHNYRVFHDDRSAVNLAKSVGLAVIAFGFLISSIGVIRQEEILGSVGLSLSRGAFLVVLLVLVIVDTHRGDMGVDSERRLDE